MAVSIESAPGEFPKALPNAVPSNFSTMFWTASSLVANAVKASILALVITGAFNLSRASLFSASVSLAASRVSLVRRYSFSKACC